MGSFFRMGMGRIRLTLGLTAASISCLLFLGAGSNPMRPPFEDITASGKIQFRNEPSHTSRKYLPETMGGGVALFDYDKDGWPDVFFVNGAALSDPMQAGKPPDKSDSKYWNRLYRNNHDGTFAGVTERAHLAGDGYGMGVAIGDYDNDGWPDVFVTNVGHNSLYHNNHDGTFSDVTGQAGIGNSGWSAGAVFVDYDRDGLLDLFVSRYVTWDFSKDVFCGRNTPGGRAYCHPDQFKPITHLLFHNEGRGRFRDVSAESGIAKFPGKGLGVAINDYDRDGWPDIAVANDSFPEQLFHNLKNGKFEDVASETGVGYDEDGRTFAGMGIDFADYDNDGWPDIFINALAKQRYALFHNERGSFEYVSGPQGIGSHSFNHSGWGTKFIDYDNDGLKDLFIGQGHVMDNIEMTQPDVRYLEPPMLLHNAAGKFSDVSAQGGPAFHHPQAARGVAFGDINNDGFVDIVINCNGQPAVVLAGVPNGNHWVVIDPVGSRSNLEGLGAEIHVVADDGKEQYAVVSTASSYLSASDKRVYLGLGPARSLKLLEIDWPSGRKQRFESIKADQIFVAKEGMD
jgi:hypothetical protein